MIRTLDFNAFSAGTVIDDEYEGVTIAATGGSGQAMIFDSANPTGGDNDLASDTLEGLLIISEDGDSSDPDDNACGGTITFDFDNLVRMKSITFKDIEETGVTMNFYAADGTLIDSQFVRPTADGGEVTLQLFVPGTARFEVVMPGSGAIDNVTFDDPGFTGGGPDGIVSNGDDAALIDIDYTGDPDGDRIDNNDAILPGAAPQDDIVDAQGGDDTIFSGLGDDIVYAGSGDDLVEGGSGNDSIYGGTGDDRLLGGTGDDLIEGGEGDDFIEGNEGDDTLYGGQGNDTVLGGDGNDLIDTGNGELAPDLGYPYAATDPLGFDPDADPNNDRDYVEGGDGNDTIRTGDDRDTIYGGDGDDVINAGIDDDYVEGNDGDDRIVGGEGNDFILGGAGNDTIYGGNDPDLGLDVLDITDEDTGGFSPDRRPDNGRDTIDGGDGDDVIYGADDDDLLIGGAGNDYLDGQIDDDTLIGGTGDDTLIGGQGNDSLGGGDGNDVLDGGTGDDTLRGNRGDDLLNGGDGDDIVDGGQGNDTLFGDDGNDTLSGAQGDDVLYGGAGDDVMTGGNGMDTFMGGTGNDTMMGGADQDTFSGVNGGDVIDGGADGIDQDTLDLRGSAPAGGRLEVTYTSADQEDGFVTYFDADGNTLPDLLVFEEIETIVPCFTPGTKIATPKGERLVEKLQVGDRIITRDNGIQEIRWVGARDMSGADLERAAHLKPVLIRQGALGNDLPERDMMVSPNHRVLVANDKTALYFEEREVLVAAKHLTGLDGVDIVDVSHTTYIHIMFDQHEVVLSDGTWTESFQPGDLSLAGVGNAQRNEILELFPELATSDGIKAYAAARRSLKKHEAQLLTK